MNILENIKNAGYESSPTDLLVRTSLEIKNKIIFKRDTPELHPHNKYRRVQSAALCLTCRKVSSPAQVDNRMFTFPITIFSSQRFIARAQKE